MRPPAPRDAPTGPRSAPTWLSYAPTPALVSIATAFGRRREPSLSRHRRRSGCEPCNPSCRPRCRLHPNRLCIPSFQYLSLALQPSGSLGGWAPLLRPPPCAVAWLAMRAPPRQRESRGKDRNLRDKFSRSGKFPGSSGRTLTRIAWRGCIWVAMRWVLHVPERCREDRFPPRASMRRAATTRSEALRGGKRERRQSTRMPRGALSVGRWAGCA